MINGFKAIIAVSGLLICSAEAHADRSCDNSPPQGQYAFRAQGATVGILDYRACCIRSRHPSSSMP